jgi:hypothetical protein
MMVTYPAAPFSNLLGQLLYYLCSRLASNQTMQLVDVFERSDDLQAVPALESYQNSHFKYVWSTLWLVTSSSKPFFKLFKDR